MKLILIVIKNNNKKLIIMPIILAIMNKSVVVTYTYIQTVDIDCKIIKLMV